MKRLKDIGALFVEGTAWVCDKLSQTQAKVGAGAIYEPANLHNWKRPQIDGKLNNLTTFEYSKNWE